MWESEQSLVEHYIRSIPKNKSIKVMCEVETNFGRPDVLLIEFNQKRLEQRLLKYNDQLEFTKIMGYFLAYLSNKRWVKINTVRNSFLTNEINIEKTILSLKEQGLIEYNEETQLVKLKNRKEILVVTNIQAYEAKLTKWKYAIEQAERHLWFTGHSAVLLPNVSTTILDKTIAECKSKGLGLTLMLDQKTVTTALKPQKRKIIITPLLWQINEQLVREAYYDRKAHKSL